jgi:CTP:molybdopterin cytidylyltransferase MocA
VQLLRDAFDSAPQNVWAVVPEFSGQHGHPYLVGRELIEVFLQASATASARDVEHRYQEHIRYVEVRDPFVALNVNTPEDYAALLARH